MGSRLRSLPALATLIFTISAGISAVAQVPEFDFYPQYRQWASALTPAERADRAALLERYRHKLTTEGIATREIERRLELIRTKRDALEADFWNRFFTSGNTTFNQAPNEFLVSTVQNRKPGKALDVGMGEGRNTLYLAKLGWDATGIDPAEKALEIARNRAKQLGLKIHTVLAHDRDFDFGTAQWDLVLFSWMRPSSPEVVARLVEGLKPGGIVVLEAGRTFFQQQNGALETFKALRILYYQDQRARSDYFNRDEMDVIRMVAEKPASK